MAKSNSSELVLGAFYSFGGTQRTEFSVCCLFKDLPWTTNPNERKVLFFPAIENYQYDGWMDNDASLKGPLTDEEVAMAEMLYNIQLRDVLEKSKLSGGA